MRWLLSVGLSVCKQRLRGRESQIFSPAVMWTAAHAIIQAADQLSLIRQEDTSRATCCVHVMSVHVRISSINSVRRAPIAHADLFPLFCNLLSFLRHAFAVACIKCLFGFHILGFICRIFIHCRHTTLWYVKHDEGPNSKATASCTIMTGANSKGQRCSLGCKCWTILKS